MGQEWLDGAVRQPGAREMGVVQRQGQPGDVARAVLYLSCDDSAGVTGTSLVVDGGYLTAAEWETAKVTLPEDLS